MTPNEKRPQIRKTLAGFLFAVALMPCAHAAPNCIVKFPDGSTQAWQPVHDEKLGYCVLWELFDPARDGVVQRITYDSGKVRNIRADGATGFQIETEQSGDLLQLGGAWPHNEYTRHLPAPDVAQDKAFNISVGVKKGRPDDWHLIAIWFKHDEDVFKQLTSYPGKLKRMGFANVIRNHEMKNQLVRDEKFPPDALMAFSYAATNSAGYRAEVICGRPLQSAPDADKVKAAPLATTAMAMPRMLPCTITLKSPVRASEEAKKEAYRKAREEKTRKDRENRRRISDDFFNDINKTPD
jgi:hypothetical protein